MKTLNLVHAAKSDIQYVISTFPDGQQQVVIDPDLSNYYISSKTFGIQIQSRLNSFLDLELIICATQSLRNLGIKEIHLYTPWIMGLRSDRLFQEGGNRYVKDVLAPIINSQGFVSVTCLDPHSDVAENCINNLKPLSNSTFVAKVLEQRYVTSQSGGPVYPNTSNIILISPDGGALKKIHKVAERIGYQGDIITCTKHRDLNGQLSLVHVPLNFDPEGVCIEAESGKDFVIVDDIIDGGKTFINIASAIKEQCHNNKIILIVTHAILSKGVGELQQYIDTIYCTNSYKDFDLQPYVLQYNVFQ